MPDRACFDERYESGDIPWCTGRPDLNLVNMVNGKRIKPGKALDISCGTGENAIWLAGRGFEVTGIDFSPLAIEAARKKAKEGLVRAVFFTKDSKAPEPGLAYKQCGFKKFVKSMFRLNAVKTSGTIGTINRKKRR